MSGLRSFIERLAKLEPTVLRSFIVGAIGLLGAIGVLVTPGLSDSILAFWIPLQALLQALIIRPAVTANAKVVVAAPDPINNPGTVVAGEATTTATSKEILDAAKETPRG